MTIIAAVKTSTDFIIAADSKITTSGVGGKDDQGNIQWLEQTYDYGTKISFSVNNVWTVAIAGQHAFGEHRISDVIENYTSVQFSTRAEQEADLINMVRSMETLRNTAFEAHTPNRAEWPATELLISSSDAEGRGVRVWHIIYDQNSPQVTEILKMPGIYLMGSYEHVFTLLYDYNFKAAQEIATGLDIPMEGFTAAYQQNHVSPVVKINVAVMPVQDAMELAAFLAKVQIQMERFLPGTAKCGGPIDLVVIRGLPRHEIMWFPGKEVKHPGSLL